MEKTLYDKMTFIFNPYRDYFARTNNYDMEALLTHEVDSYIIANSTFTKNGKLILK